MLELDDTSKCFQQHSNRSYEVKKNKRRFSTVFQALDEPHQQPPKKRTKLTAALASPSSSVLDVQDKDTEDTKDDSHAAQETDGKSEKKLTKKTASAGAGSSATSGPNYVMRFAFNLPLVLTAEYHARHCLSLADFESIFRVEDVHYLWMMALFNKFDITTSAIQSCHANVEAVTYSGNTVIVTKLLQFISKHAALGMRRRFICAHDQHRRKLPVHFVTLQQLERFPAPTTHYDWLYKWKDIYLVPYRYYNGYLQLVRVLPRYVYNRIYGEPVNLISRPFEYLSGGVVYCSTTESMLVQTYKNHKILRALPDHVLFARYSSALFREEDLPTLDLPKGFNASSAETAEDSE